MEYEVSEERLPGVELRVGDGGLVVVIEGPLALTPGDAALFAQDVFRMAARATRDIRLLDVAGHG